MPTDEHRYEPIDGLSGLTIKNAYERYLPEEDPAIVLEFTNGGKVEIESDGYGGVLDVPYLLMDLPTVEDVEEEPGQIEVDVEAVVDRFADLVKECVKEAIQSLSEDLFRPRRSTDAARRLLSAIDVVAGAYPDNRITVENNECVVRLHSEDIRRALDEVS